MEQQSQPQSTPPQEESIFTEEDFSMRDYNKHIRNARIMLFVIAGIQLLPIFTVGDLEDEIKWIVIGIYVFIAAVFAGFAFWAKYNPYSALLTAIIFFVALHVASAILDPLSIVKGIILKIVAIVLLINGIRNAKEARDLKRAYGK